MQPSDKQTENYDSDNTTIDDTTSDMQPSDKQTENYDSDNVPETQTQSPAAIRIRE